MVRQHVISSHRGEYVWVCAWMCVFWKTANLLNFHSLFGFCSPSAAAIPSVGVVHYSAQCFDNVRTFCCLSIVHVGVVACVHMLNVFGAWSVCQVARANRRWHKLIVGSLLQWFRKPAPSGAGTRVPLKFAYYALWSENAWMSNACSNIVHFVQHRFCLL